MNRDKKMTYSISFIIFAVLLGSLFINVRSSRIVTALLLLPLTVATFIFIKKRCSVSINKKEVLLLNAVIAVIYVVLKEMTGLYFKYYKNPYFISLKVLLQFVLPLTAIIVMTELIRSILLAQKNKLVEITAFVSCVLAEVLAFTNLSGIRSFNTFMDLVGLTLFPAIIANVYYHYVSKRYGALPNITFRLITTLYTYFIPTLADMSDSLTACIKLIIPIVMLAIVSALYEKKQKKARRKGKTIGAIGMLIAVAFVVSVAMLISCQFKFGAIVIATESMTGEINKGDMILYEKYEDQAIEEGQVIVFLDNGNRIVHRVVKIERIGNEVRYYTKGDANDDLDAGYITHKDIVGLTDVKIAYLGYPTLWLRQLLKSS